MVSRQNSNYIIVWFLLLITTQFSYAQYEGTSFFSAQDEKAEESMAQDKGQMSIQEEAFNQLKSDMRPLSNGQIKEIKKIWTESQRAQTLTPDAPPRPVNSSMMVNLDNGSLPSVIRIGAGIVSVVSFFDSHGKPWPIRGYNVGNPSVVDIQWQEATAEEEKNGDGYSNTMMLQAQSLYKSTNMIVLLRGLGTPVLIELIPGQKEVDYRLDIQVPRAGPNAETVTRNLPSTVRPVMLDVLNNIPPEKGSKVHVKGGNAQAWLADKKIYLRTPLEVISPAWMSRVNGANKEMSVYELPFTTAILALSDGKIVKLTLEGI